MEKSKCVTGQNASGQCGAAAYCSEPYECCAQCYKDCNSRCELVAVAVKEGSACRPESAQSMDAAATTSGPAAASPEGTSTILVGGEDAAASIHKISTESTQASPSGLCSPAASDTAAPLACAASAPATPAAGFDFGADAETNALLFQDAQIFMASSMARVMAAKQAHDRTANNYRGSWGKWCEVVGISRDTGDNMVRVAERFGNIQIDGQNLIDLQPLKLLYAASKPSTPAEAREKVETMEITSSKQFQELLAQLKAKDQALADEKTAHQAESKACSIALEEEYQRRQQAEEARDKAEKIGQTAQKALDAARDELRTKDQRIKELETRPIEVKGADAEDIARWRAEGAKPVQDQLNQALAEAAELRQKIHDSEAWKKNHADELSISKQIVSTLEGILRSRFEVLDSLDYDTFEAAVEPFEALRDRLNEALEVGKWPIRKENT